MVNRIFGGVAVSLALIAFGWFAWALDTTAEHLMEVEEITVIALLLIAAGALGTFATLVFAIGQWRTQRREDADRQAAMTIVGAAHRCRRALRRVALAPERHDHATALSDVGADLAEAEHRARISWQDDGLRQDLQDLARIVDGVARGLVAGAPPAWDRVEPLVTNRVDRIEVRLEHHVVTRARLARRQLPDALDPASGAN